MRGLYVFRTRKGEIHSAAATFFAIMTFPPLLLLVISMYGKFVGDVQVAYNQVMELIRANSPNVAPSILANIEAIIRGQLNRTGTFNWVNTGILAYSCIGVSASLNFGIHTLSAKEQRGGEFLQLILFAQRSFL